jgi:small subunit ribosomal protein S8
MTDPIADMLTRIRNAQMAGHSSVIIPRSKLKVGLTKILKSEGFVEGYVEDETGPQGKIKVFLKYDNRNRGSIRGLTRISRPGRRAFVGRSDVPRVRNGLGVAIPPPRAVC